MHWGKRVSLTFLREWQSINCFHLNINNNHCGRRFSSVGWAGDHMPRGLKRPRRVWVRPVASCCMPSPLSYPPLSCQSSLCLSNKANKVKMPKNILKNQIKSLCNTGVKALQWIPSCIRCLCRISCTFVVSLSSNAKLATLLLPTCCWGSSRWWGCTWWNSLQATWSTGIPAGCTSICSETCWDLLQWSKHGMAANRGQTSPLQQSSS